jgi:hypothetical protein
MRKICGILALVGVLGLLGIPAWAGLQETLREQLAHPGMGLEEARARYAEQEVVFVGGFLNEALPTYFEDNVRTVRREIGASSARVLRPRSALAISQDAEDLAAELREIHRATGRRIVAVGHSKGGAGAVLAVILHPELLDEAVTQVVGVQAAVGGTPIADGAADLFGWALPGIESLRTDVARETFAAALGRLSPEQREKVSARVAFARGEAAPGQMALQLRPFGHYLQRHGLNDGMVTADDQRIAGFGTDLGVIPGADHVALMVSGWLSNQPASYRRAFTRALFVETARLR